RLGAGSSRPRDADRRHARRAPPREARRPLRARPDDRDGPLEGIHALELGRGRERMSRARRLWSFYATSSVAVLASLVWISATLLGLEKREAEARIDAAHQSALRLALWRMDSYVLPLVALEASRPYFEYLPYYPEGRSYTCFFNEIKPG